MGDNSRFIIINNFSVHWNGVVLMLALAAGILLAAKLRSIQKRSVNHLLITAIVSCVCAFCGSRIYYYWNASEYFSSFSEIFNFSNGGYAMYGAIIGSLLGTVACAFLLKENIGELLDATAPGIALAIGIGRWGALFTGENLGPAVDKLQKLPFAVYRESESSWMCAFFFYQSIIALLICGTVSYMFISRYAKETLRCRNGDIYMIFLLLYTLPQGVFELFRIDPLYFHPIFIRKLRTVPISLAWSAIISAAVLSYFILRRVFRSGVSVSTAWPVAACAVGYLGYFNITMRIELDDRLATALVCIGCLILTATGIALFVLSNKEEQAPLRSRSDRQPSRRQPSAPPRRREQNNPYF